MIFSPRYQLFCIDGSAGCVACVVGSSGSGEKTRNFIAISASSNPPTTIVAARSFPERPDDGVTSVEKNMGRSV